MSVSGAGLADDNTFAVHFHRMRTLAVVKPGDVHWTVVDRGKLLFPAMSFAGRFYCATDHAVMVVETSADRPPRLALAAELIRPFARIMMDTLGVRPWILADHMGCASRAAQPTRRRLAGHDSARRHPQDTRKIS